MSNEGVRISIGIFWHKAQSLGIRHSVPCALRTVPCALCPAPCALCPAPCALCPVPCAYIPCVTRTSVLSELQVFVF